MKTILEVLQKLGQTHDFNKPLGVLAKNQACLRLSEYFENPKLRIELNKCANVTQMANTIQQHTKALTIERTPEDIEKFKAQAMRLIKIARL